MSGNCAYVWRVIRNLSPLSARIGVLKIASSYTSDLIDAPLSSEKPAFLVQSPYVDSVSGLVRSTTLRSRSARVAIGSGGTVRAMRKRIESLLPAPLVIARAPAAPPNGRYHKSYLPST